MQGKSWIPANGSCLVCVTPGVSVTAGLGVVSAFNLVYCDEFDYL